MVNDWHGDIDSDETSEWVHAIKDVIDRDGVDRAQFLLNQLATIAGGGAISGALNTDYINTIPPGEEAALPGDYELERRINAIIRWNAVAMVMRAGRKATELGGHIASFASAATLYDVGFNHFFHAPSETHGGDLVYVQGHCSPGIYARSFVEGRLSEEQLDCFRQEVGGSGLSSYPHPWLMPDYWQFATVSMGLGPLMGIYQARFMKYLQNRGLSDDTGRKVWVFCGDGEMDEPESRGAIHIAGRESLDNLVFVINCNLQRLDGPVWGNGKIIQELEACFRGAGWNVIKAIWGRHWDPLFAADKTGLLIQRMNEAVDGDYQNYKANDGAYVREHFFGKYPELRNLVSHMSDEEIWRLNRGGHDAYKIYAAYDKAVKHKGQPTVILAKTVKGYGMGHSGEGLNITHQQKKMAIDDLKRFRDRFEIPVSDEDVEDLAFYRPEQDSPEVKYMHERRAALGGPLPARHVTSKQLAVPGLELFKPLLEASGDREISTTMAFVRLLGLLVKDKELSQHIVPIVPDESRTFGMEGMFRQLGIYSSVGQLYTPVDKAQVMYYREEKNGQILQEGISEAGAMSSWIAAGTSYANSGMPMIPFFIYYSMFGFQRFGDLAWAAGDMQARGFLLGGTAGRTTLAGEGLQHQDGHNHLFAATIPNCRAYDPTFAYELAVIVQDGLRRMYHDQENIFYYISVMNENYTHPAMPESAAEGIVRGMYQLETIGDGKLKVQLLGSGAILRECSAAAELLAQDFDVSADVWSVTSFTELRREGLEKERLQRQDPQAKVELSYVTQCLQDAKGPVIAATDYIRSFADQIRAFVPGEYTVLGTDGYGRSDTRQQLRYFFEVDKHYIAYTAVYSLVQRGELEPKALQQAQEKYGIDSDKPNPTTV